MKKMRFLSWLKEKSDQESRSMIVAELVEKYLSKPPSLKQIKSDVAKGENQSRGFQLIEKTSHLRRGVHLYCILDIDEAIGLLSTPKEQKVLGELKRDLAAAYLNYTDKPVERIHKVLTNFAIFLKIDVKELSDRKKAKELYHTIYLSLCLSHHGLHNISFWEKKVASWFGVDTEQIKRSVLALMKQIEEKIMTLDVSEKIEQHTVTTKSTTVDAVQLASTSLLKENETGVEMRAETELATYTLNNDKALVRDELNPTFVEQRALMEKQRAIQNYFDKQYLALFTHAASTPDERLKSLCMRSSELHSSISELLRVRGNEEALKAQQAQIQALLNAFNANDSYIYGRKYFSDLKKTHAQAFKLLIELSPEKPRTALLATIDAQSHNSRTANFLYVASGLFSPLISASRLLLPKGAQDFLTKMTPTTLDAQAKKQTQDLALTVLANLAAQLKIIETEKHEKENALSQGNTELNQLIASESSENLAELAAANRISQSYEELAAKLRERSELHLDLKEEAQSLLQQRYLNIMQGSADEKANINNLVGAMGLIVKDLNARLLLENQREALLEKIDPLEELMDVFNHHSTNKLIGPVANEPLKQLLKELEIIDKEIDTLSSHLGCDNKRQKELFKVMSADDLRELIAINTVAEGVDKLLMSVVTQIPPVNTSLVADKTAAEYFIERYRSLVNHDTDEEEQRLNHLDENLTDVDESIKTLVAARTEYDALALKAQEVRDILDALKLNKVNPLLVNLIKERSIVLDNQALSARRKLNSLAQVLALGKEPVKQALLQESIPGLLKILEINKAAKACIEEYKLLKDKVSLLNQMNQGARVLDSYVYENYTWWIRLTDFLAQFFAIFKTKASELIDEAKALKGQLLISKVQCEQEIRSHIAIIDKDSSVGSDLLADLPDQHNYEEEVAGLEAFNPEETKTLLSKVSMFKPKSPSNELSVPALEEELDQQLFLGTHLPGHC
ncbi:hypothetical protein [Legionella sp. km772]|uniref:hypothetical protein n=1 Tax=Legionella sp. km772 TaxID=2498111 RepID=UPI000F9233EC|nr:hypothetical protein [Legionella sp. km772]RUR06176.1 hypothetical protein ELY15_13485 [Legionella sp. km772]